MKYSLLILICFSANLYASENKGYGLGIGSMYSGAGVNMTFRSKEYLQYNAVGCKSIGFGREGGKSYSKYRCGIGIGFVVPGIIPRLSRKSSLDFHLGIWHAKNRYDFEENQFEFGVGYIYFKNGFRGKGLIYGVTPVYVKHENYSDIEYHLNIGYQFR